MRSLFMAFALTLAGFAAGCGSPSGGNSTTTTPKKQYACPMECATSDKPGACPKCGMEMKEVR